jgi:hypothetical protein
LPASAAMPGSNALRNVAVTPIAAVQYRHTPRQLHELSQSYRDRNGYNAYASQRRAPSTAATNQRSPIPGWPCTDRTESSEYSAFPSWDICN